MLFQRSKNAPADLQAGSVLKSPLSRIEASSFSWKRYSVKPGRRDRKKKSKNYHTECNDGDLITDIIKELVS